MSITRSFTGGPVLLEFEYDGKLYSAEVDGYKALGLQDEEGNYIDNDDIYAAALQEIAEWGGGR